jgi:hypothetical protein
MKPPVNWSRVLNSILVSALIITLAYKSNPPPPREIVHQVPVEIKTLVIPGELIKLRAGCGEIHHALEQCVGGIYNDCIKKSPGAMADCIRSHPRYKNCYEKHNIDLIKLSEEICEDTAPPRVAPFEDDGDCQPPPDPCDPGKAADQRTLLVGTSHAAHPSGAAPLLLNFHLINFHSQNEIISR